MNIAIVDSSKSDAEILEGHIKKYFQGSGVAYSCVHFRDGIKFLESGEPFDLVFMETELPYRNGFRIAESMRQSDKDIGLVFYTSYKEGAIKGYAVDAVDYLVKPLDYNNFSAHFKHILRRSRIDLDAEESFFLIKTKKKLVRVNIDDIVFVEVNRHTCVYHLVDSDIEVVDKLSRVAETLRAHNFEYCNACYLVNMKHVSKLEGGYVYLGATSLKVSRGKAKTFSNRLIEFLENT